ncbi:MAG: NADH-quinone oxidoreductase subunit NuoN [Ectobacillus sp.]
METLLSLNWGLMMPEFIIVGAAILLSLLDLFAKDTFNRRSLAYIAFGAAILALVSLMLLYGEPAGDILDGTFVLDGFAKAFKTLLLLGAALVFLLAMSDTNEKPIADVGEYYYLFLTALLGAMFMTSSNDLITLFVGLELLTVSSFILVGIRKHHQAANEAAMKYVINGGISTAITLFGLSYLYGLTGTTNVIEMRDKLGQGVSGDIQLILSLAFLITFVGLSFKLATAPFHMWAPDVYQGAATPVTAFLGTVSKLAGFVIILRIFLLIFAGIPVNNGTEALLMNMRNYIVVLAAITMIVGNIVALKQSNAKRLFAYSGIAHAGYLLVPFVALSPFMMDSMWFYMLAYVLMNIGAFAVIHALNKESGKEGLGIFAGLYQRSPLTAVLMAIFILSLAGIPGTAGFIGKINIFLGVFVMEPANYILPAIMMGTTVVSFVYYFRVLQLMFFRQPDMEGKLALPAGVRAALLLCAIFTVLLGVLPAIGYDFFYNNFPLLKDFFFTGAK